MIFCCTGKRENYFGSVGRSVGKIRILILSFKVGISKNKNINHGVTETCAIMSIKVTYEIDHICLLRDSTISRALNRNLKEKDHIKRNINSKKKMFI